MIEWKTMETAPLDEPIIIYDALEPNRPVMEARLMSDGTYYDPTYNEWFSYTKATLWMPLPAPPMNREGV